jgi:magnesium chelatase subunit D
LAPAVIRRERAPERAGAEPAVSADPPPPAADGGPAEEPDRTVLTVFEAAEAFEAVAPKAPKEAGAKDKSGRRGARETLKARGRAYRTTARRLGRPLSLSATLRAAAPLQAARRAALASALVPIRPGGPAGDPAGGFGDPPGRRLIVSPADFREKVYRLKTGRLVIFVVDASGSIGALYRMEEAKAAALALLRDAYRQRDRVAVISFHGRTADLLLPPTNSPDLAGRLLAALPSGGKTPMAAALALTARLISIERARDPKLAPHVVLMTDGRPNVPLDPASQPWPEVLGMASRLAADPTIRFLLIDTDRGAYNDYKLTRQLALRLGCRRITIEDLRGGALDRWLEG